MQTMATLTAISPFLGTVNLNINGTLITGAAFNSSPTAPGVANINVANGAIVDATRATIMRFGAGSAFQMNGTGALKRTVPGTPGVRREFPVGIGGSYNPLTISSESGSDEVYTVGLTNVPVVPPPAKTLPRAWGIAETTPGGNIDTLWFSWTTADEGVSGFVSTDAVYVGGWNGSTWVMIPATKSGSGTLADPYVARVVGAFVSTAYILTNSSTTPVSLVNMRAAKQGTGIQVEFGNATELNVREYIIEKSADGRNFVTLTTLLPKTNNGGLNSYAYTDVNPYRGNNAYRIKAIEKSGNVEFSTVISLNLDRTGTNVNVYPNPVKGNSISIQLENLDKAVYTVVLYNGVGQKVFTKQMNHDGNTTTLVTTLPLSVKTGIYRLQVSSNSKQYVRNIIVE
jgi:Secretion system C-terminal sorting domain